jgi:hypothetical protein
MDGMCQSTQVGPEPACIGKQHAGHSYFFCDSLVDHATASARCVAGGMNLVHIDDAEENAFIDGTLTTEGCCPESLDVDYWWRGLWIGANDLGVEDVWIWDDDQTQFWMGHYDYTTDQNGEAIEGRFASWKEDQPNGMDSENCARTVGLLWSDTSCELFPLAEQYPFYGIGYICENKVP